MKRLRKHRKKIVAGLLVLLAVLVLFVRDRPIARAAPHALAIPPAPALAAPVRACWAEMGRNEALGQVASAGFTHIRTWEVTVAGLVVRHPKGDLVVDVGNSSAFAKEIVEYTYLDRKWLELLPGSNRIVATAPEALRALGVSADALTVVVSHAHPDHMGGLVDLPRARVLMPEEELAFARRHQGDLSVHVVPAHARALADRTSVLVFAPRPYETFDESADIFGDGSVVVVKLFGHTPGSVGVFVNVTPSLRMFHVGDAVNVVEAVERRLTKSVIMASTDVSGAGADAAVARIAQLHEAEPGIAILPAHDRAAWARVFGEPGRCVGP